MNKIHLIFSYIIFLFYFSTDAALTMLTGGIFCRYFYSGWLYLFAITGIFGFIWLALWIRFTANSPDVHRRISKIERDYICTNTGSASKRPTVSLASIPWKNIITSKPLIALFVTHNCNLFGLFFFLTNLGKVLTEIHKIPTEVTGYILSCGYILTLSSSMLSGNFDTIYKQHYDLTFFRLGIATDRIVHGNIMTLTNARKLFNSLTSFVPALCMASLYFCDESRRVLGAITVLIFLAGSG